MKRPFETVTETFFENLDKLKENQRYNFANSERFMIWIVGFSIGGLSIIVTNLTQFNQSFSHCIVKTILMLLSLSILSGIVYRWAFYLFQIQYQNIEFYLQGAFSNKEIMDTDPDDLTDETDIKEVVRRLKSDFGEDASFILEEYSKTNDAAKLFLLNDLKGHYKKVGESVKKEYEFAMNYVKKTYKEAFGLSDKRINKLFNSNTARKLQISGWTTAIAFFISCLSFITVIVILCIAF
jgi:hypothetical protein